MWIIPSNHPLYSHFAQEVVCSRKDLRELSEIIPLRLMWRSKPFAYSTWYQRWKRVWWCRHLFSRTLKLSSQSIFAEKLMELLEDIPVSHFHLQATSKEKMTNVIYGHTSVKTYPLFAQDGACSKMSQTISILDMKLSGTTYKNWVIKLRKEYSQRRRWALHMLGNDYLSSPWRTPTTQECEGGFKPPTTDFVVKLRDQVLWSTPAAAQSSSAVDVHAFKRNSIPLGTQVMYPTPIAQESEKWSFSVKTQSGKSLTAMAMRGELTDGPHHVEKNNMNGKRHELLNPAWVAQLMGTTLEKTYFGCTAMELYRQPQIKQLSIF